ncbi:glycosyltransferase [Longilinea arvoryzae]|uniref:Glycosyltransferase n=1 Tax=Longilinea arvoryzae TaxID=360412 RepID=A0A0S7BLK4_9CHLR|nr:glycosyltransferase family 2 protein [Longilinea arvoryzae]GAP15208.1 glycosyltransferase [Longilinea arvoryzae]
MTQVSIIIPCYNEQATIPLLLQALYDQTYPRARMEVVIADGLSTDRTREAIAQFQSDHPDLRVRLVSNPRRHIPAGLNVALAAATGEIVIRLDAHSVPALNYVERCVRDLESKFGDNVGGVWEIQPGAATFTARAISAAAAHPFGVGDALYRYGSKPGPVDTVPFGSFYRAYLANIGGYDETLLSNEDYELNTRIRLRGGRVFLDPDIHSVYFSRPTFSGLAKQYFRYGYWKLRMLKRYPATIRWRQALPPLFAASILILALAGLFLPLARWLLLFELGFYLLALIAGSVPVVRRKRDLRYIMGVPLAISVMHFSWGFGFLWSLIRSAVES